MGARALCLALCAAYVCAQPPCVGGVNYPGNDLGALLVPSGSDAQWCAEACYTNSSCRGFVFLAPRCGGCAAADGGGCCMLKSSASSSTSTSTPACACSFIMRADPASLPPPPPNVPLPPSARNVLYVLVDDLRPDVGPYGAAWMSTPAISSLARGGASFDRAYVQIAVCSPSRMSFLTGRYPHHTRTWNFLNNFRQANCVEEPATAFVGPPPYRSFDAGQGGAGECCSQCTPDAACVTWGYDTTTRACHLHNVSGARAPSRIHIVGGRGRLDSRSWVSLPQHFARAGWQALGSGKIFHTEEGGVTPPWDGPGSGQPPLQDPVSWVGPAGGGSSASPLASMANVNALAPMRACGGAGADGCSVNATPAGDVPPGTPGFCDRIIADDAVAKLRAAAAVRRGGGAPFFLAVGFRKPHLPFRHPAPFDALYPAPAAIPLAAHPTLDASVPPIAYHQTALARDPYTPLPALQAGTLRRDYYAAISWVDSQIARLLAELDGAGLANDTAVVFHADHGWSLGEAGEWEKFTCWEHGTRIPLVVRAPWLPGLRPGARVVAPVQAIDVFPTLAELAGVPVPPEYALDGVSLVPLLTGHTAGGTTAGHGSAMAAAAGADADSYAGSGFDANASAQPHLQVRLRGAPTYALSVFPRCPADLANASMFWSDNDCMLTERSAFSFMGVSLRVAEYRYTEWLHWNASALRPRFDAPPVGVELYNHSGDDGSSFDGPFEQHNHAGKPAYAAVQAALALQMRSVYPQG